MSNNIQERTFNFSIIIVSLCDYLAKQRDTSYQISKQLVRSGTSIGANVSEAQSPESTADFIHKMNIALKEARETYYWLRLLIATKKDLESRLLPLLNECNEIIAILVTIIKNSKNNKK